MYVLSQLACNHIFGLDISESPFTTVGDGASEGPAKMENFCLLEELYEALWARAVVPD
jgi:hypothetical protein